MIGASGAFRVFGKLASEAEFVYLGASSEAFARFDDWLTEGVEWALAKAGPDWADCFVAGGSERVCVSR